jgi:YHS domain-containing protein
LLLVNNKYAGSLHSADACCYPVCGIEMHQELAISHEHHGKIYYFCCEGCKRIFTKKPRKYSK